MLGKTQEPIRQKNKNHEEWQMTLNNSEVNGRVSNSSNGYIAITSDLELINQLLKIQVKEVTNSYFCLYLDKFQPFSWCPDFSSIQVYEKLYSRTAIHFEFDLRLTSWKHIYSFDEFDEVLKEITNEHYKGDIIWNADGPGFIFFIKDDSITIQDYILESNTLLKTVYEETLLKLHSNINRNSLVTLFNFPLSVKVPCEQYLLYFIQFLRDIGIEATANLEEQAGQVLFSVTPKDENEALDKIRHALEIYLRLPTNPNIATSITLYSDVESQRLASNVLHVQSQLMLAHATIRQQESHIQRQETLIQQLLTGEVLAKSLVDDSTQVKKTKADEDKEPLLGDIVHVRKWEPDDVPLSIDLPSIFRRLKKFFGRGE